MCLPRWNYFLSKGSLREISFICNREETSPGENAKCRPREWIWRHTADLTKQRPYFQWFYFFLLTSQRQKKKKKKKHVPPSWIHSLIWMINTSCTCPGSYTFVRDLQWLTDSSEPSRPPCLRVISPLSDPSSTHCSSSAHSQWLWALRWLFPSVLFCSWTLQHQLAIHAFHILAPSPDWMKTPRGQVLYEWVF